jgi:hypothetical protein
MAVIRLGYGWEVGVSVEYRTGEGQFHHLIIVTDKPNNWRRILFVQDQSGRFRKIENGMEEEEGFTVTDTAPNEHMQSDTQPRG